VTEEIPVEPTAEARMIAYQLRQMFLAFQAEGFTEEQSLIIIGQMVTASALGGPPS
jgi:hypothetical protein